MNSNEKYNMLVREIANSRNENIYPKTFGLNYQEFKAIIDEIENDGLFEKGFWAMGGFYIYRGLSFKGRSFLENNDKKEYPKIEKTEINYHNNIHVGDNNHGTIITGNNNTLLSEFDQRFDELILAINNSNISDRGLIVQELQNNKNDKVLLKKSLGVVLTKGAEIGSILSAITSLFSL